MRKVCQKLKGTKKGAASFYIVAFSTLILVLLATSFAMVITSEIARTANDDLSQSAYDSALAGVEDAKLAFSNYRRCVETKQTAEEEPIGNSVNDIVTCKDIMWWMNHKDCYMVGHILGKIPKTEQAEVVVGGEERTSDGGKKTSSTNQAYTCVMIETDLYDYRSTLTADKKIQTMRASVGTASTNQVKKIRLSWYSVRNDVTLKFRNFQETKGVKFPQAITAGNTAVPPTVELQIVQTAENFKMSDFDRTDGGKTDRGTLYLVPTDSKDGASRYQNSDDKNYIGTYKSGLNTVEAKEVVDTNNHSQKNRPFAVYCGDGDGDFYCSVDIILPDPINSSNSIRNNSTFMLSVSLPYQQPDTDFSIELFCDNDKSCGDKVLSTDDNPSAEVQAMISNTQIAIDSTGRANDLYRRVETRLESADTTFGAGYPYFALQVLGNQGVTKNMTVKYEKYFRF